MPERKGAITENIPKDDICWFCKKNPADGPSALSVQPEHLQVFDPYPENLFPVKQTGAVDAATMDHPALPEMLAVLRSQK